MVEELTEEEIDSLYSSSAKAKKELIDLNMHFSGIKENLKNEKVKIQILENRFNSMNSRIKELHKLITNIQKIIDSGHKVKGEDLASYKYTEDE